MSSVQESSQLLNAGSIIAFPTETVYGLGASIHHPRAIQGIYTLKGRPPDNPLIVHVASIEEMADLAHLPQSVGRLAHFWPGPLTIVVNAKSAVPEEVRRGLPTVALRIPSHPIALELLRLTGPLVAPSANLSGKPSPTEAAHVLQDFDIPVVDGGPCQIGLESTILSLVDHPQLLRPGAITKEELETALGQEVKLSTSKKALAPGMKYRHYAPKGQIILFEKRSLMEDFLHHRDEKKRRAFFGLQSSEFYKRLRDCDLDGVQEIILLVTEEMRENSALMNRLEKARLLK